MSVTSSRNLFAFVGFVILYRITTAVRFNLRRRRFRALHGCQAPPKAPAPVPFGLDAIWHILTFRGDILDDVVVPSHLKNGLTYTAQNIFMGEMLTTADPRNLQALLATQFQDFQTGAFRRNILSRFLGNGIFTADGQDWSWARKIIRPQFQRSQLEKMDVLEPHVQALFDAIPEKDGEVVELAEKIYRLTLDSSTEFLFGESVGSERAELAQSITSGHLQKTSNTVPQRSKAWFSTGGGKPKEMGFSEAFTVAQSVVQRMVNLGPLYYLLDNKRYKAACTTIHAFTDYFVERAYRRKRKGVTLTSESRFILADALAAEITDPIELRTQLLNILLAGRDTTASLLSFVLLMLSQHEHVFARLRNEILESFGTDPENISFSGMKSVKYLQWVLHETLRLYPAVPFNLREAVCDTTLPFGGGRDGKSPIAIMKGEMVYYSVYVLHRREEFWGPDMVEFRPERWEGRKTGFEFLPFNAGPRICLGQQYALAEAGYVVSRFLQRFEKIEGVPETMEKAVNMTLYPKGVRLRLYRAQNDA